MARETGPIGSIQAVHRHVVHVDFLAVGEAVEKDSAAGHDRVSLFLRGPPRVRPNEL